VLFPRFLGLGRLEWMFELEGFDLIGVSGGLFRFGRC